MGGERDIYHCLGRSRRGIRRDVAVGVAPDTGRVGQRGGRVGN